MTRGLGALDGLGTLDDASAADAYARQVPAC